MDKVLAEQTPPDHRGLGKKIKYAVGDGFFRALTVVFNKTISLLPYAVKYGVGTALRKGKYPYSLLESDDFVVQLGAPRDTLTAGRSRAVHFSRLLTEGTTVVIEPDPDNCVAFKAFLQRHGLDKRVRLIESGAWNAQGQLEFLTSEKHPAANLLSEAKDIDEATMKKRGYKQIRVPVDTLENLLAENGINGTPKLVSVTTNGAERQILEGMSKLLAEKNIPYISLALTGSGYPELMQKMGYEMLALDDRGYTFRRRTA